MVSQKAKQLLVIAAKKQIKKIDKVNRAKINKKINRIKYLSSLKKFPKTDIRRELKGLEKELSGILSLEEKLKKKSKEENKEITKLKNQLRDMKKKLSACKDKDLRKKVEKLSHLVGDVIAKKEVKKEVEFEKAKLPPITLSKIDELDARILAIEKTGKVSPEKIAELKKKLVDLEWKTDPTSSFAQKKQIKHKMMFKPPVAPAVKELEDELDGLPVPPPPKIVED